MHVKGATIATGTAIATFNQRGNYEGHAAIYIKQDKKGIYVYDQWTSRPLNERLIIFRGYGDVSNDGDQFYVIE
ncbi:BPSL0067 family protein [Serratia sp. DD3]|uniref:BPSL0067 family protein n=1 Tax=Serratia sp. DD3 TaxID=1410619 RepID=UPI0012681C60